MHAPWMSFHRDRCAMIGRCPKKTKTIRVNINYTNHLYYIQVASGRVGLLEQIPKLRNFSKSSTFFPLRIQGKSLLN